MDVQRAYILLEEADQMVAAAAEEMMRAEEDVITHSVCFNSRQAIINYLTFFLLSNGIRPEEPSVMANLLAQCRGVDPRFRQLNIENIQCRFDVGEKEYCLSVPQVDECLNIARRASDLVKAPAAE